MMKRMATLLVVALSIAGMSTSAMADNGKGISKDKRQQIRDFFECATTPAKHFPGTIVEAALATPQLKELANAVVAAGLVDVLSSEGPFTVYAPVNRAFKKIPAGVLNGILSEQDEDGNLVALQSVLTYHVTQGRGFRKDPRRVFNRIAEINTVQGQQLFFSRDRKGTEVNQSNLVSCQPVSTRNGVVYLIDSVMLPQF